MKFYTPKTDARVLLSLNEVYDAMKAQNIVSANAFLYDTNSGNLKLCLTPDKCIGIIHKSENEASDYPYQALVGSNIPVRIYEQIDDKVFKCERESVIQESKQKLFDNLTPGAIITTAQISSFIGYGAFVDIGNGVLGFLHVNDMTSHPKHPTEQFKRGDMLSVAVKQIDYKTKQFFLTQDLSYHIPFKKRLGGATQKFFCTAFCHG